LRNRHATHAIGARADGRKLRYVGRVSAPRRQRPAAGSGARPLHGV